MALALTPKTTIGTLLGEYPFLLSYLAAYHPDFKKLTNPVARHTVGRMATIERAAAMAGVPTDKLMADIAAEVKARTGESLSAAATTAGGVDPARQQELKAIVSDLHAGKTPEEVKPRFEALIKDVEATEIAAMEQALISEGVAETEVKRLCDVHMQVFQEALDANPTLCAPAGHPIDTFQRENRAATEVTKKMREAAERLAPGDASTGWDTQRPVLADTAAQLAELEKHYVRKENQLFPFLEKHGVEGPSKVMWALHDDIRAGLKELRQALADDNRSATVHAVSEVTTMVDDMVNKEEKVLFPMAFDVLSEEEWREIRRGEGDVGYALVSDVPPWPAEAGAAAAARGAGPDSAGTGGAPPTGVLELNTGLLTREQLHLLLGALPLDLTFVDERDEVRFYSEGERVFPRSPGVIGRKVQNCHPPASVHKVQQIVDAFRAGEKDVAEFWITVGDRFVHIRYFAVRNEQGAYRGVVETVQDVTHIRNLQGQRRLLDW